MSELTPMRPALYTAEVLTHDGWWFRFRVNRLHGISIPENSVSYHRTLAGARRAAQRWVRRNDRAKPETVEVVL